MSGMFEGCSSLTRTSLDLSGWNTQNVTSMSCMFRNCSRLTDLSCLSNWDVSAVTNMQSMFSGCSRLTDLSCLSEWDVSAVITMSDMFHGCSSLTSLDLSGWNTQNVTSMSYMFYGCSSLTSLDLSGWNTQNVTSMSYMFYDCSSLTSLDLSSWDTSEVTSMNHMFSSDEIYSAKMSLVSISFGPNWNTHSVKNMSRMFYQCSSLTSLDLSNWNPTNNVNTSYMFYSCYRLETIYCKYSWTPKSNTDMFKFCTKLKSETTGKTYKDGYSSSMANPVTGLFTMPEPIATYTPTIQKTVLDNNNQPIIDWDFEPGQFTFNISSDNPNVPLPEETEVQTDNNGLAIWSGIKYYEPGEYIYKIEEKLGNIPGITYDTFPHELNVVVKEE